MSYRGQKYEMRGLEKLKVLNPSETPKPDELLRNNLISNKSSTNKLDSFYHKIAIAYTFADICCLFGSVAYISYPSGIKNTLEAAKARVSFDNMLSTDQTLTRF